MKKCERCGEDIGHHTLKSVRYCQLSDRLGVCYRARINEYMKKKAKLLGVKCEICGKQLSTPRAKSCRGKCHIERQRRLQEAKKQEIAKNKEQSEKVIVMEWPYKMPVDASVTPADMCPLW